MPKLKTFNVVWEERWSINIKANDTEEAEQKILDGEYNESDCSVAISSAPDAYEMEGLK